MAQQKGSPIAQWQALSSLYEQACELDADARQAWLEALRERDPTLHQGLRRMLDARDRADADGFLDALPPLTPPPPRLPESREGARIGPYRLVRRLGAGGMAEVWLGERDDGAFRRRVAVKLPYVRLAPGTDGNALARRFDRERDILASLRHPNVAGLIDAGVSEAGEAWLALEYVEGEPIGRWCDERRASLRERVRLFRQVLLAVQHAHANLVIHRDLKPANVLVTAAGEVRLLDFGIAKLLEGNRADETELTRLAGAPLTPRYASPEQLTGAPLTTACDVYALGVVLYELLCGLSPYETRVDTVAAIERAIVENEPRAPSRRAFTDDAAAARATTPKALRRALAPELDAIVLRCLAKTPAARYSSVDALIAEVDRWLNGEAVLARAPGPWTLALKFAARNKAGVGFGVAAVVALVATAAVAIYLGLEARIESARASAARDFMLELFKRADAEKSRGADITARELLDAGRRDVLTRLSDQPTLQAELLHGIAEIQSEMGERTHVDLSLRELVRLRLRLGQPRLAGLALAEQALNAVHLNQPARAEELLAEARRLGSDDAELHGRIELAQGWVDLSFNRASEGLAAFEASRLAASRMAAGGDKLRLEAGWGTVEAQRRLGRLRDAEATHRDLVRLAETITDLPQRTRAWNVATEMEFDFAVGRYAKVARSMNETMATCDRNYGPDSDLCRRVLLKAAQTRLRIGGSIPDAQVARLQAIVADPTSPFLVFEAAAALYRRSGVLGHDQAPWRDKLLQLTAPGPETKLNPVFHAYALGLVAEFDLRRDLPEAALPRIARALEVLGGPAARPSRFSAYLKLLDGVSQLRRSGGTAGMGRLVEARQDLIQVTPADHPGVALFDLAIAVAHYRAGDTAQALRIWDAAEPTLRVAYGSASAFYAEFRQVRDQIASGALSRTGPFQLFS